jgi:hypothetical protein
MQFFTCYDMVFRRGFFVQQQLFCYDSNLLSMFENKFGFPKIFFFKYVSLWLNLHKNFFCFNLRLYSFGENAVMLFGYISLFLFTPNNDFSLWYKYNIVLLHKLRTRKGRRIALKFPANGQRTRSNSSKKNLSKNINQQLLWK